MFHKCLWHAEILIPHLLSRSTDECLTLKPADSCAPNELSCPLLLTGIGSVSFPPRPTFPPWLCFPEKFHESTRSIRCRGYILCRRLRNREHLRKSIASDPCSPHFPCRIFDLPEIVRGARTVVRATLSGLMLQATWTTIS